MSSAQRSMPQASARIRTWALSAIGLGSAIGYGLGITARYPLAEGLRSVRAGWSTLAGGSLRVGLGVAAAYALLTIAYMLAMRLALGSEQYHMRKQVVVIVLGWLLCSAALLNAYPSESLDIFDYLFRGRMLVEYGASPLATPPSLYADRPFYAYITWRGQVDTYGPLWEYASAAVAWLVHYLFGRADSQAAYILGYRLMAMLWAGLCGLLIGMIVRRHAPQHLAAALLAWFWNPLLLLTSVVGAHNDLLMIVALLAALLLMQRGRWLWALLALALAAHVKLTALLVLPMLGLWLLRRCGWWRAVRTGALALLISLPASWLLYAPLGGWASLQRMLAERARFLINSPADMVYRLLQERLGWSEPLAWRATTQAATLAFLLIAALILAWFWWADRHPGAPTSADALLWRGSIAITVAYLLVGSFWFQHWYLLWVLAPAALLPADRWTQLALPLYCLGALWSNLANSFARNQPAFPLSATQVSAVNVLAYALPLLGVLLAMRIWHAWARISVKDIRA